MKIKLKNGGILLKWYFITPEKTYPNYYQIDNFITGNQKTIIIAKLSANHNHDYNLAVKTIKAVKYAGADAIKLESYTAETITIVWNIHD